jgi:folate-dependent tRNA-U54 methylase TrmFO/GidA
LSSHCLDVIVGQLAGLYPFFDIFASDIGGFKKELLDRTKKPKEKAQVPECTQMTFVFCYIFLMHQKNLRPVNNSHQLLNL